MYFDLQQRQRSHFVLLHVHESDTQCTVLCRQCHLLTLVYAGEHAEMPSVKILKNRALHLIKDVNNSGLQILQTIWLCKGVQEEMKCTSRIFNGKTESPSSAQWVTLNVSPISFACLQEKKPQGSFTFGEQRGLFPAHIVHEKISCCVFRMCHYFIRSTVIQNLASVCPDNRLILNWNN